MITNAQQDEPQDWKQPFSVHEFFQTQKQDNSLGAGRKEASDKSSCSDKLANLAARKSGLFRISEIKPRSSRRLLRGISCKKVEKLGEESQDFEVVWSKSGSNNA